MPFISCYCLITVTRTFSSMWIIVRVGTLLVPDLTGNAYSSCTLSIMVTVAFYSPYQFIAFITLRFVPSISTLQNIFIGSRERQEVKERENYQCERNIVCLILIKHSDWGLNMPPRHVPRPGTETLTLWFIGRFSNQWGHSGQDIYSHFFESLF